MKHITKTYELPEDCFVSQLDSRSVGIFYRESKKTYQIVQIPYHVDCRDWSWRITPDGKVEMLWDERDQPSEQLNLLGDEVHENRQKVETDNALSKLRIGQKVAVRNTIEHPDIIADIQGETGTIIDFQYSDKLIKIISVQLDKHFPELAIWNNCIFNTNISVADFLYEFEFIETIDCDPRLSFDCDPRLE